MHGAAQPTGFVQQIRQLALFSSKLNAINQEAHTSQPANRTSVAGVQSNLQGAIFVLSGPRPTSISPT